MADPTTGAAPAERAVIDPAGLGALLGELRRRGHRVIGPTVRDGAVLYDDIEGLDDLPAGWTDEQDGGRYRLHRRDDDALFGYAVGPHSWKRYLFPPRSLLWRARRTDDGFELAGEPPEPPRYAFVGVRSCGLHAIDIQDRVFLGGDHPDPTYASNRGDAFLVAVSCGEPGGTCFCASMGTGPRVTAGYDLALTELLDRGRHELLVEVGSARGAEVLATVPHRPATPDDVASAEHVVASARAAMGREMPEVDLRDLLAANLEHPRWDDVAARCLTCSNCTMVCPTCFCHAVEETTGLTGDRVERWRSWDSCFTVDFSHLHGGSVRPSNRSRYRQWMTHKLGTWWDQFGTSGCVGCGRCITWCPVGIDLTEEVRAMLGSDGDPGREEHR